MRRILYLATVALALGFSAEAFAQGMGGGGMGGGGMGGGGAGGGGNSFGGGGGAGGGNTFSGGGNSLSGGGNSFTGSGNTFAGGQGMNGTSTGTGRTGAGGRALGGSGAVSISPTNFLAATYGNPLYNGRPGSANISLTQGGGFGQPSFGSTTTTTNPRNLGRTGIAGGTATVASNYGVVGNVGIPITFAMEVKFPVPPIQAPKLQADLQGLISRTSQIRQPGDVRVEVAGTTVILRGRVANDDERRLVEGMVRMEPGVQEVRNELRLP